MDPRNAERLTKRQHDVMLLLTTGAQDKEIAATLGCGLKRVKQHTSDCYGRLGVRNRVQAAVLYWRFLEGVKVEKQAA